MWTTGVSPDNMLRTPLLTIARLQALAVCLLLCAAVCAQTPVADGAAAGIAVPDSRDTVLQRYTFSDFFDALDLPTVLGAGITPGGIEGAAFNSSMRLGWRHHKGYGTFVFLSFDTHSNSYDSLSVAGTNVRSGEVWYYEIGLGVGYRVPVVKDLRAFYAAPYANKVDWFVSVGPGISVPYVKTVVPYTAEDGEALYQLRDRFSVVPVLRFATGVEWFIVSNFAVFAEVAYSQHLLPTVIEQAAMDNGLVRHPSGPVIVSAGLSLFFN